MLWQYVPGSIFSKKELKENFQGQLKKVSGKFNEKKIKRIPQLFLNKIKTNFLKRLTKIIKKGPVFSGKIKEIEKFNFFKT